MTIVDPGHVYLLDSLDGEQTNRLVFVKRVGEKYPGNANTHPGTTTQEVLRALIERAEYVQAQTPCVETGRVIRHLTRALVLLEMRAARRHGRRLISVTPGQIISGADKCRECGHVGCRGECRA